MIARPPGTAGAVCKPATALCKPAAALCALALAMLPVAAEPQAKPTLDFEFFRVRVEPIFLQKRAGHARCYMCHAESNNALHLERLTAGQSTWTREQSRRNFEVVSKLVNPGDPETSRLLLHPLAPEGGGDVFHSGGRQFAGKDDPAWKTIAQWVDGQQLPPGP
jgi:hypothetical protein